MNHRVPDRSPLVKSARKRSGHGRSTAPGLRRYPATLATLREWKRTVRTAAPVELEQEKAMALRDPNPVRRQKRLKAVQAKEARFKQFSGCGSFVRAAVCGAGHPLPGSGKPHTVGQRCELRLCPFCARGRSMVKGHRLLSVINGLKPVKGYGLKLLTVTLKYNPESEEDLTVPAMQERAMGGLNALRDTYNSLLKGPGTGLYTTAEMSDNGFIHVHGLYYGPFIDKNSFEAALQNYYSRCGFTGIEEAKSPFEVTKYTTKGPSPLDEDWLLDGKRECLSPSLAIRWELATYNRQLCRSYGAFRGHRLDEEPTAEEIAAAEQVAAIAPGADTVCEHPGCGLVGDWQEAVLAMEPYVRYCHARGERAFAASRWTPPQRE